MKIFKFTANSFTAALCISTAMCSVTKMPEKIVGGAVPPSIKIDAPKELGEDLLLSDADFVETLSVDDSLTSSQYVKCKSAKADVALETSVKASARRDLQSLPLAKAQSQEQSFWTLASECFICCQDILIFGLAIVSLGIWRFIRVNHVGEDSKKKREFKVSKKSDDSKIARSGEGSSALNVDELVKAMYSENKDDLRKMLDAKSLNACDDLCCCTALHVAAHYKCMDAAEALLERGADVDVKDVWDETPLHFAARAGHIDICALLLKKGAQINAANLQGWTPLLVAAEAGMEKTCQLLLDHAAHTGGIDEDEVPPLLNRLLQCRIVSGL